MSPDLSATLVIGISATALFDLRDAQVFFDRRRRESPATAVPEYRDFMLAREREPLADGTGMALIRALLALNAHGSDPARPLVEVVVLSRNSPETGVQVFHNIRRLGLPITRHAFTGGESVVDYLDAFDVDLFLTTNAEDAQRVIDEGHRAAAIVREPPRSAAGADTEQVRIAFDGDAVLFDDASECIYKTEGLVAFQRNENEQRDVPLAEGPYAIFLKKLAQLQQRLAMAGVRNENVVRTSPIRIALVTARSAPAEMRVINTLRHWGVQIDEVFFLGGISKEKVLRAFRPHIYFDDQDIHLDAAAGTVSAGKVPWRSGSRLHSP